MGFVYLMSHYVICTTLRQKTQFYLAIMLLTIFINVFNIFLNSPNVFAFMLKSNEK